MEETYNGIPRLSWESDHEWQARTSFLESNKDYYSGDRLASLSMAWSNWIFMGCNYGPEIQDILNECHARLPPEVDQNIQKLLDAATPKVKFVKAQSESLGTRIGPPQGKNSRR